MSSARIIQFPNRMAHLDEVKAQAAQSYRKIFNFAADPYCFFSERALPKTGVFDEEIRYSAKAEPTFPYTKVIDDMRKKRGFTRNAVELRCDSLSLAIYVSGVTQYSVTNTPDAYVRVVAYSGNNNQPDSTHKVASGKELVELLHELLVRTYNQMALKYNLAGYRKPWLALASSNTGLVPKISMFRDA